MIYRTPMTCSNFHPLVVEKKKKLPRSISKRCRLRAVVWAKPTHCSHYSQFSIPQTNDSILAVFLLTCSIHKPFERWFFWVETSQWTLRHIECIVCLKFCRNSWHLTTGFAFHLFESINERCLSLQIATFNCCVWRWITREE